MEEVGKRIRELRESMNMPQKDLARDLGISQGHLSGVESGKRPLGKAKVALAAQLLGVSFAALKHGVRSTPQKGGIYEEVISVPVYSHAAILSEADLTDREVIVVVPTLSSIVGPSGPEPLYGVEIDGEICLVNPNVPYETGDTVLVNLGGSLARKRILLKGTGGELREDEAAPLAYTDDDLDKWITILGKITFIGHIPVKRI